MADAEDPALELPEPRAQRTLVKSPPELWAEVSDPGALTRHLGDLGEIRITHLDSIFRVFSSVDGALASADLATDEETSEH